jgi:6-phosphogluconolactonase
MTSHETHSFLLASGYAEASEPTIAGFELNEATGELQPCGTLTGIASPSFMVVHPGGELYLTSETHDGAVLALRLGQQPGSVTELSRQPSGGDWPCHLLFSPDGHYLAVANYGSGTARLFPRMSDGRLGLPGPIAHHAGRGPHPDRQEGPHAHATIFSPDGRFAIVADLGIDRLKTYTIGEGGVLQPAGEGVVHGGAGPRHMAWHPTGQLLYVANELDSTVSSFAFDPTSGTLTELAQISTIPPGAPHNQVADIHLDAGGKRLYVSNRGHNSIAVYQVAADGQLSLLTIRSCGGDWPRNFALSPGGGYLIVANQHSGKLAVLPIVDGPEALGDPVALAPLPGARCVIFPAVAVGWGR